MGVFAMTHLCNHDTGPANGPTERTLEQLWVDFVKLQRLRSEFLSDFCLGESKEISPELVEEVLTPIASEMRQLLMLAEMMLNTKMMEDSLMCRSLLLWLALAAKLLSATSIAVAGPLGH